MVVTSGFSNGFKILNDTQRKLSLEELYTKTELRPPICLFRYVKVLYTQKKQFKFPRHNPEGFLSLADTTFSLIIEY